MSDVTSLTLNQRVTNLEPVPCIPMIIKCSDVGACSCQPKSPPILNSLAAANLTAKKTTIEAVQRMLKRDAIFAFFLIDFSDTKMQQLIVITKCTIVEESIRMA